MHAVVLDIDGTLIQSDDADTELYVDVVRSMLGPIKLREQWESYAHVTDTGILEDLCIDNKVLLTPSLLNEIKRRFVAATGDYIGRRGPFQEIPGARDFVLSLQASEKHQVAYATGGWTASAKLKLASAGFPLDIPLASSDDSARRTSIMMLALAQLGRSFTSVSYFGDGPWDRDAAKQLGWKFVAVGKTLAGLNKYDVVRA